MWCLWFWKMKYPSLCVGLLWALTWLLPHSLFSWAWRGSQPWQLKVTYSWWTAAAPLQLTPLKHSTFKADSVLGSMLASLWCYMERCWVSVNLRFARSFQDSSWLPRVQGFHKVKESHSRKHSRMHCEPEASILLSPFIPTCEIFSNPVSVLFLSKQFFVSTA